MPPPLDLLAHAEAERAVFAKVRNAEAEYARKLRRAASHISDLVSEFITPEHADYAHLEEVLARYAGIIEPWARAVATKFLADVINRDNRAWTQYGKRFSRALRKEIETAPTGIMLRDFLDDQVGLITSLPLEAAKRVHDIAVGNLYTGARYSTLAQHLEETAGITRRKANLIARTESARVASGLTMVRAKHVGSTHYIWRTVRDHDVRPSHKKMEGHVVSWDDPPEVDPGKRYHAGMFPNCRCYPEVIIPERYT